MSSWHTCRFCKQSETANFIKYGVRHYAHLSCLKAAYTDDAFQTFLRELPTWQLRNLPEFELRKLNIREQVEIIWRARTEECHDCHERFDRGELNGYNRCNACQTAKTNARHFTKDFNLATGDEVLITVGRSQYSGTVLSANFWGEHDGWYVEFTHTHGGYGYWKQGCDGGSIRKESR
jgi:hypothetical protein